MIAALRRFLTTSVAVAVVLLSVIGTTVLVSAPGPAQAATDDSAATVSGQGPYADLKVTVSQTKNLVDQVVKISWKGGTPTVSDTTYAADYLQIMQCWGDAGSGPDPDQCQFGGSSALGAGAGSQAAGAYTNTRQLTYGDPKDPDSLKDPAQQLPPASDSGISYVPFRSVSDVVSSTGNWNDFYDVSTTNEIPYARTGPDGTGEVYFEAQTGVEAPGLGCGEVPKGASGAAAGRKCWLVVVPRGESEVDGTSYTAQASGMLQSSPLSASNWQHRLVVPLSFEPIGNFCPIGADERSTLGNELVTEAIQRWEPALCQSGKRTIYSFASSTDHTARIKLRSDEPGMVFLGRPATGEDLTPGMRPVYAPVSLSGLTIGFFIESQSGFSAPDAVRARDGARLTSLNLTPRLLAKLLTESYQDGNSRFAKSTEGNPFNLGRDPEFLKYNPDYADLDFGGALGDVLVPEALSDSTWQLWNWVNSDPAAREFLSGTPDNQGSYGDRGFTGMTVNPNYKDIALPREEFPKSDPFCQQFADHPDSPLCIQDKHPYANDLHNAARSAARGDTLARSTWDATTTPPGYKKNPPQAAGKRAILALTDTATAARYGLVTARLQNAAGRFVAPSTAGMLAAQAAMKPSGVAGVDEPDPTTKSATAYPLTLFTYAATVPENLTRAEGQEYAALLRYAAGNGQRPGVTAGTLPEGYAPLPASARAETRAAADAIAARAGKPGPGDGDTTGGTGTGAGSDTTGGSAVGGAGSGDGGAGTPGDPAGTGAGSGGTGAKGASTLSTSANPSGSPSTAPAAADQALPDTPDWALGAVRYALLIALVTGLAAAVCGPVLPTVVPRLVAGVAAWRARDKTSRDPGR
ncbi:hypothetical protein [Streptomyces brasiliensis]|uniref:PBP domain-containing protein n=1 Tax=Streptomyces brasiliensis TaxID=1954 RepID=A0A917KIA7_9ACTN|nr:hypothetical protein [Streptomyces brasiliensis]GGJ12697.1 hypothetical protein GCM10010121_023900 [Streptomyces brasiliensis]